MPASSERNEAANLSTPATEGPQIMKYENYNFQFRDSREIYPYLEIWKKFYKPATSMDQDYVDVTLEKHQELEDMLLFENSTELIDLMKYPKMCNLAFETCREYFAADPANDKFSLIRLEAAEGGLAVTFDLLADIRTRNWRQADTRQEQALLHFGDYLAEIHAYFRNLPSWRYGPLS